MNVKKLDKIFNYYRKKHKLNTFFDIDVQGQACYYKYGINCIFLGLKYIDRCSGDLALQSGYLTLEELNIFVLLHEIKHAIDYKYHLNKIKSECENLNKGKYLDNREYHHQQLFEIRADNFAKEEIIKWLK